MDEQKILQIVRNELDKTSDQSTYNSLSVPRHIHNGTDSLRILFTDITKRMVYIQAIIQGTSAATDTNYGTFFIVPSSCYVNAVYEVHGTAGSDGGAVTLTVEKLTGTQAKGSGTSVLNTTVNLKATKDTVQIPQISTNKNAVNLATGDRLSLLTTGTLTAVAQVCVIVEIIIP